MRSQPNLPSTRGESRGAVSPLDLLQSQIDRVFSDFSRGFGLPRTLSEEDIMGADLELVPSLDVRDADGKVIITAELPGVDENNIDIAVDGNVLTISGEKHEEIEEDEGDFYRSERIYGRFSRSVTLPFEVDPNKVDARFERGVLRLEIPKPDEARQQRRKIAIKH